MNAYILYQEWDESRKCSQTEFKIEAVKQILGTTTELNKRHVCIENTELERLTGHHFIRKICQEKKLRRSCKVCVAAERIIDNQNGVKRKRRGHESSYQCHQCQVPLCIELCFELYHNYKDYMKEYIKLATK